MYITFSLCCEDLTVCDGVLALLELDECVMLNNIIKKFGENCGQYVLNMCYILQGFC